MFKQIKAINTAISAGGLGRAIATRHCCPSMKHFRWQVALILPSNRLTIAFQRGISLLKNCPKAEGYTHLHELYRYC